MDEKQYFIKANVFGKTRYWDFIDGFHTGRKKIHGFSMYTIKEAKLTIKRLKKLFHDGIEYEILHHDELPFIKKQRIKK